MDDPHRHPPRTGNGPGSTGSRARRATEPAPERAYNPAPEYLPPRPQRPRLGVFGGSFNPVHNGHLFIAGHLLRAGLLDEVLFVPAGLPPHKLSLELAPGEHRFAMLRAALAPWTAFSVSDIELQEAEGPTYTFNTLETLRAAFPERHLFFILGSDSLQELHTWYRATELVNRSDFLVYPRPDAQPPAMVELVERFGVKNAQKLRAAQLDAPLLPIAASTIRECCVTGRALAGLLPDAVAAYIAQHRLYARQPHGDLHGSESEADRTAPDRG